VDVFDLIAERRVAEAIERGEFDDLPGAGRPIALDDDSLVAPELRVAYRLLRNAGYVPEEVRLLSELRSAEQLLARAVHDDERTAASARLHYLLGRLGASRVLTLRAESQYFEQLVSKFGGRT
jgi:hypothetical protein